MDADRDRERAALDSLAAQPIDESDVALLRQVAAAYSAADAVPAGLVERLIFDVTVDDLHAEIARLERTSMVGARTDSAPGVQTVTFTSQHLTTMVTISRAGADRVRIDGWLAPGAVRRVELTMQESTVDTTSDEDGRFVFDDVPAGLARFVITDPLAAHTTGGSEAAVITPSLELQPPS